MTMTATKHPAGMKFYEIRPTKRRPVSGVGTTGRLEPTEFAYAHSEQRECPNCLRTCMPRQDARIRSSSRRFQTVMTIACVATGVLMFFVSLIADGWPVLPIEPNWGQAVWRGVSAVMVTTGVVWAGARSDFRKDPIGDVLRDWRKAVPFAFALVGWGAFMVELLTSATR